MHASQSQRSQALKVIASCRGKHDVSTCYIAQALARGMTFQLQWHEGRGAFTQDTGADTAHFTH